MTATEELAVLRGRAWTFGDDVNTDDMYPGFALKLPMSEAAEYLFHGSRPGWASQVLRGDVVVAGRNFGLGSSRPVAELFAQLGISCLIADEFNSLFFRNCINYGLPALSIPDARSVINEGDVLEIDLNNSVLVNRTRALEVAFDALPPFLLDMLAAGGLLAQLRTKGLLRGSG